MVDLGGMEKPLECNSDLPNATCLPFLMDLLFGPDFARFCLISPDFRNLPKQKSYRPRQAFSVKLRD